MLVVASDGGSPQLTATCEVTVNIDRNLAAPVFGVNNGVANILEIQPLGDNFYPIPVSDSDIDVSLQGHRVESSSDFFY